MRYKERKERILVCSWNTIRLTDVPIYKIIDESLGIKNQEILQKMCIIERDVPNVNYRGVSDESVLSIIHSIFPSAYFESPTTAMYNILSVIGTNQIEDMIIAHNTFGNIINMDNVDENELMTVTFDGTVEELEKLIDEQKITAVIIDDIEYLYHIILNGKIDVRGMTFMFPMLGYNFDINNDGTIVYKYFDTINSKILELDEELEISFTDLFIFNKEEVNEALSYTKKENGGNIYYE